jgi:hypothetical protein
VGGIPIGLQSDAAYLGAELADDFMGLLAVPPELGRIADVSQWRLETLAALVARRDLAFVSVWSPTFFLDLVDAIEPMADAVAARTTAEGRERLRRALRGGIDTAALWPELACLSCWTDGASSPFARRLAALFPRSLIDPKGLLATEAPITIGLDDGAGAVPALASSFVEFVDEAGTPRLCDEVEPGGRYRVIITTWGGLYRYDIGDLVRCVGREGEVPRLRFEGRAGVTSDLVGEKLDDGFVAAALRVVGQPAMLVPRREPHPHYELWLETADEPARMAEAVDRALEANPQYAYARRIGQLGAVRGRHAPDFLQKFIADRVAAGARLGDTKAVALLVGG